MEENRKAVLLELLQRANESEKAFVADLSAEEKEQVGTPEKWSAKDTLAHIAWWRQRLANSLQSPEAGSSQGWVEDTEKQNAEIFAEFASQPWDQVQDFADRAHRSLLDETQRIEEDQLESLELFSWQNGRPVWRLIITEGYTHPYIHLGEYYQRRGEASRAAELISEMSHHSLKLDDGPAWQGLVHYNLACSYAMLGEKQDAIRELGESLRLNPDLTEWSQQDTDLDSIREEPGYQALYTS